ncbi:MAG: class F sortase [Nocardioides sp.]|nr:class F sortase [Nocardioides sp.]
MKQRTLRVGGAAAAVLVALLLLALLFIKPFSGDAARSGATEPTATASVAPSAAPSAAPTPTVDPAPATAVGTAGAPDRIIIPALDVDSRVIPIQSEGRVLDPPNDPNVIGWWSEGARPGASTGSALLTGHTIHTGDGALKDLEQLGGGDEVTVNTAEGPLDYAVTDVQVLTKDELAARAESLFDQSGEGRLVVITCEDWDGESWQSNVVVTAVPS